MPKILVVDDNLDAEARQRLGNPGAAGAVAALTVYDMCKAVDRGMRIADIRLVHKAGGKSGTFTGE